MSMHVHLGMPACYPLGMKAFNMNCRGQTAPQHGQILLATDLLCSGSCSCSCSCISSSSTSIGASNGSAGTIHCWASCWHANIRAVLDLMLCSRAASFGRMIHLNGRVSLMWLHNIWKREEPVHSCHCSMLMMDLNPEVCSAYLWCAGMRAQHCRQSKG